MEQGWEYDLVAGGERVFEIESTRIVYGPGALRELGTEARGLGLTRVALFTDVRLARLEPVATATAALCDAGCEVVCYDAVRVEPTDASFSDAAAFAAGGRFDGFVSVGGGSVMDTAKAANLYGTYPGDFFAYVNAPVGDGKPIPGPLRPHIACPTTCGTGSEVTGIAICDVHERGTKTGIASRRLRPTLAIVDPLCTRTLPSTVVACTGFDVLCHALESYTALPFTRRPPSTGRSRPMAQGANPFSDMACVEALGIIGAHFERAVNDRDDERARECMMYAATLAGVGFGNAGVHGPHAMAYALAGAVRDYRAPDYPADAALVPHGMAVIESAPAWFRFAAHANPDRALHAAGLLGADTRSASAADAGEVLAARIESLMRATGMPLGIAALGFAEPDAEALATNTLLQRRLLANAPCDVSRSDLIRLFKSAMQY